VSSLRLCDAHLPAALELRSSREAGIYILLRLTYKCLQARAGPRRGFFPAFTVDSRSTRGGCLHIYIDIYTRPSAYSGYAVTSVGEEELTRLAVLGLTCLVPCNMFLVFFFGPETSQVLECGLLGSYEQSLLPSIEYDEGSPWAGS
jgi:hypothetical protein